MNVRDLKKLEMENLSNGGRAILDAVGPSYEYRNGQKTDKVNGLKVTVVFPANRYAKHTITVEFKSTISPAFQIAMWS